MEKLYKVVINGVPYEVLSDCSEERINEIETYVNNKMVEILEKNPRTSSLVAAIFTAMSAAEEMFNEKENAENLKETLGEYKLNNKQPKTVAKSDDSSIDLKWF